MINTVHYIYKNTSSAVNWKDVVPLNIQVMTLVIITISLSSKLKSEHSFHSITVTLCIWSLSYTSTFFQLSPRHTSPIWKANVFIIIFASWTLNVSCISLSSSDYPICFFFYFKWHWMACFCADVRLRTCSLSLAMQLVNGPKIQ